MEKVFIIFERDSSGGELYGVFSNELLARKFVVALEKSYELEEFYVREVPLNKVVVSGNLSVAKRETGQFVKKLKEVTVLRWG